MLTHRLARANALAKYLLNSNELARQEAINEIRRSYLLEKVSLQTQLN
jgi:hypothetical protein